MSTIIKPFHLFPYQWHLDEEGNINIFGLSPENKTVLAQVQNFTPYVYMELSTNYEWTTARRESLRSVISEFPYDIQPVILSFMEKKKLYFADVKLADQSKPLKPGETRHKYEHKTSPFLFMAFKNKTALQGLIKKMAYGIYIPAFGLRLRFKFHEQDASEILQLTSCRKLPMTDWITGKGNLVLGIDQVSTCVEEYKVNWSDLIACEDPSIKKLMPRPKVMMFDNEANSTNINTMPKNRPGDKIFQISFAVNVHGEEQVDKYLLSLGEPDPKKVGEDVKVLTYRSEGDLLVGFTEMVHQIDPQVLSGYNIMGWDIDYMVKRAKLNNVFFEFSKLGYLTGVMAKEKKISWSSSAFNAQNFYFLDIPGRLFIDMLPIVKRDVKLDRYDLGSVSAALLKVTKDPLTHKGIFKCYRMFTPSTLGLVGRYCLVDSVVTLELFRHLKTWIGMTQLSNTFNVPIIDLTTQGQQLRIYSQVYRYCMENNFVVQKDGYVCGENERYTGAIVLDPVPGMYEDLVTFDFASLYPSVMISNNIDYSTLVLDEKIPDEDCHVHTWEDHCHCEHDQTIRKTKAKKEDIMCAKRHFRFLKDPPGVIPTILRNLLSERKKTKNEMEKVELEAKEEKDPEIKKQKLMYASVLDMRQLALKTSANSMYGGMGVRRGKLPFMPGAMCTTSGGRASIMKAKKEILEAFPGRVIYGDSVTADTPILTYLSEGNYAFTEIQNLSKDRKWVKENDKEVIYNPGVKVWSDQGFTEVKRIIRHQLCDEKLIFKVSTECGFVKVTSDHSLLDENGKMVRACELKVGQKLLAHKLPHGKYDGVFYGRCDEAQAMQNIMELAMDKKMDDEPDSTITSIEDFTDQQYTRDVYEHTGFDPSPFWRSSPIIVYDLETENHHFQAGTGPLIVHNTDSLMYIFDDMGRFKEAQLTTHSEEKDEKKSISELKTDYKKLADYASSVGKEISKFFPAPMKLEFENISKKFFILTKKRYIAELSNGKTKSKGIMISRRDNSKACRTFYGDLLKIVFAGKEWKEVELWLIASLNDIYAHRNPTTDYCITKSVKEIDQYKVKAPSKDPKEKARQYALKGLDPKIHNDADYLIRSLPAHVQLAERMRRRGMFVEAGSRIDFLVTTNGGHKAKMWQKSESSEYYKSHSDVLRIDMNYYCKSLMNPVDQVLSVRYKIDKFMSDQLKIRIIKSEVLEQLVRTFSVKLKFQ
jgi:DNA polymerase elongation subunit (family B)